MKRVCPFENQSIHHVYSKSIYHFEIFTCEDEYYRMINLINFYQHDGHSGPFSSFIKKSQNRPKPFSCLTKIKKQNVLLVKILAYCLMPTHIHFVLQQITDKGIETFMRRILNAYSKYFNLRHNRRGPLWENRFGNRLILDEVGLNQTIDYVHDNPVKEKLSLTPQQWKYSSATNPSTHPTPGVGEVL